MAMRSLTMRLAPRLVPRQVRFASGILQEEEKAAENIYIKKMEKERMEKLAREGERARQEHAEESKPAPGTPMNEDEERATKNKGIAIAAGIVALASGIYWYATSGSSSKKEDADE